MSKMYLVKPDGIDAEWNATNYGENEYTQLSMKMIMPTEKSSETYGIFQELLSDWAGGQMILTYVQ